MKNLVIGEIITNPEGEKIVDDFGWGPESDHLKTGSSVAFGRVNVFVGMVRASGFVSNDNEYDSVSGDATCV